MNGWDIIIADGLVWREREGSERLDMDLSKGGREGKEIVKYTDNEWKEREGEGRGKEANITAKGK